MMGISSIVTLGYSVSGGYQGGNKIATLGYGAGTVVVTAGFVRIKNVELLTGRVTASLSCGYAEATLEA